MDANFQLRHVDGVNILDCSGKIVLGPATDDLSRLLQELLEKGLTRLVINLAELHYIDSTGLGWILSAPSQFQERGGDVVLLNPQAKIDQILINFRVRSFMDVFFEEDEAVKSFGPIHDLEPLHRAFPRS